MTEIPATTGYRSELPWQQPNNTEGTAWERIARLGPDLNAAYLPFPWASWIDAVERDILPPTPPPRRLSDKPLVTVCQHIHALEHLDTFKRAGVTDLFWSHASQGRWSCEGVRIHPFPLYPVRCLSHPGPSTPKPSDQRALLYSYQGFHPPDGYLSDVRKWLHHLPAHPNAIVEARGEWHYEQQVYREQLHGLSQDPLCHQRLEREARSYADALQDSCFALCPSGAGPNTIRLWEALGFGAIPVILSDSLRLPGDPTLWQEAAVFVPEAPEAIGCLSGQLEALQAQPDRLKAMQMAGRRLWRRYGPELFVADVIDFLRDPDQALRDRARERLRALPSRSNGPTITCSEAIEELHASEPACLALQIRAWLASSAGGSRLLIHIEDPRPPALQAILWRSAVALSTTLLARHPDRRWRISCRAPEIEEQAPWGTPADQHPAQCREAVDQTERSSVNS